MPTIRRTSHTMNRFIKALLGAALAAFGIGCTKQPPATKATPTPFAVIANDGVRHEIYRGLPFEQFTPSLPSGSVDTIDFDGTLQNYSIALVTVPITNGRKSVQFTTTFKANNQDSITKLWMAAPGNTGEWARGVFLIPASIVSAATSFSELKQIDEVVLPKDDSDK